MPAIQVKLGFPVDEPPVHGGAAFRLLLPECETG